MSRIPGPRSGSATPRRRGGGTGGSSGSGGGGGGGGDNYGTGGSGGGGRRSGTTTPRNKRSLRRGQAESAREQRREEQRRARRKSATGSSSAGGSGRRHGSMRSSGSSASSHAAAAAAATREAERERQREVKRRRARGGGSGGSGGAAAEDVDSPGGWRPGKSAASFRDYVDLDSPKLPSEHAGISLSPLHSPVQSPPASGDGFAAAGPPAGGPIRPWAPAYSEYDDDLASAPDDDALSRSSYAPSERSGAAFDAESYFSDADSRYDSDFDDAMSVQSQGSVASRSLGNFRRARSRRGSRSGGTLTQTTLTAAEIREAEWGEKVRLLEVMVGTQKAEYEGTIGELEDRLQVVEFQKVEAEMQLDDVRIAHAAELRRRLGEAESAWQQKEDALREGHKATVRQLEDSLRAAWRGRPADPSERDAEAGAGDEGVLELRGRLATAEEEAHDLRERLNARHDELIEARAALKAEHAARERERAEAASALESRAAEERAALSGEVSRLKARLEASTLDRDDMTEQLEQTMQHNQVLESRVAGMAKEMDADGARAEASRLAAENEHLKGYVKRLNEERSLITPGGPDELEADEGARRMREEVANLRAEVRVLRAARRAARDSPEPPAEAEAAGGAPAPDQSKFRREAQEAADARRSQRDVERLRRELERILEKVRARDEQVARESEAADKWAEELLQKVQSYEDELAKLRHERAVESEVASHESRLAAARLGAGEDDSKEDGDAAPPASPSIVIESGDEAGAFAGAGRPRDPSLPSMPPLGVSASELREHLRHEKAMGAASLKRLERERESAASFREKTESLFRHREEREALLRERIAEAENEVGRLRRRLDEQDRKMRRLKRVCKEQVARMAVKLERAREAAASPKPPRKGAPPGHAASPKPSRKGAPPGHAAAPKPSRKGAAPAGSPKPSRAGKGGGAGQQQRPVPGPPIEIRV